MPRKNNFIFLQNIFAPYRIAFFNDLEFISAHNSKFAFRVFVMRESRKGRNWKIDKEKISFNYYLDKGFYFGLNGYDIHFNPRLIYTIIRSKDDVILGGSWNNLNNWLLILFKRLGLASNTLHTWSEANYLAQRSSNPVIVWLRNLYYTSIDGKYIIPGEMSVITFLKYGIDIQGKAVNLPNLINTGSFKISTKEINSRFNNQEINVIIPARLIEARKGIINFLRSIGVKRIKKVKINIVGSGPDKNKIEDFIEINNLHNNIFLRGHLTEKEMVEYYKKSHLLVLPSFIDPSPLSLIEGLYMKLPLLVSNRCGNHFEVLDDGMNGYLFDPLNPQSISTAFDHFLSSNKRWSIMGEYSYKLAKKRFDNHNISKEFIKELTR